MGNNQDDWQDVPIDDWQDISVNTKPMSFGEGLARSTLEALPTAGMMFGGALGGTAGFLAPIPGGTATGTVGGAGLGAMAGESLKQAGQKLFFDEGPKSRAEQYGQLGQAGLTGIEGEMGGQSIAKIIESIPFKGIAKKVGRVFNNIPEENTEAYINRSGKIEAPEKKQILDDLTEEYNKSLNKLESAKDKAFITKEQFEAEKNRLSQDLLEKKYYLSQESAKAESALKDIKQGYKEEYANKGNIEAVHNDVLNAMKDLKQQITEGSQKSYDILDKDRNAYSVRGAAKVLRQMADELNIQPYSPHNVVNEPGLVSRLNFSQSAGQASGPVTKESEAVQGALNHFAERMENTPELVNASELKKMIQQIDNSEKAVYAQSGFDSRVSRAYKEIRKTIDNVIKEQNPAYAKQMKEVAENTALYDKLVEKFGTSEKSFSKLGGLASSKSQQFDIPLLKSLGAKTGYDFEPVINDFVKSQEILKTPSQMRSIIEQTPEFSKVKELEQQIQYYANPENKQSFLTSDKLRQLEADYSQAIDDLEKAKNEFATMRSLSPNQVEGKAKGLTGIRQYGPNDLFRKVEEITGKDYAQQIRDRDILDSFKRSDTQGSRKTVLGSVVGGAVGGLVGGPAGSAVGSLVGSGVGFTADRYGGQMFKGALDAGMKYGPGLKPMNEAVQKMLMQKYFSSPDDQLKNNPEEKQHPDTSMIMDKVRGSEFEQVLQNALNKSKESFAAANYVLGNRNKRYQQIMKG